MLGPTDLRKVNLEKQILPALAGASSQAHRIAVLKRFYSWLRKVVHRIETTEDPTYGQLSVPQGQPAQQWRSKVIRTATSSWRGSTSLSRGAACWTCRPGPAAT